MRPYLLYICSRIVGPGSASEHNDENDQVGDP